MESETRQSWASKYYIIYIILMLAIVGTWCYARYVMHICIVAGNSMVPTYNSEDVLQCSINFGRSDIRRGDVVVIDHDGQKLVKRVIGIPGDALCVKNGQICLKDGVTTKLAGYEFEPMNDYGILPTSDQEPLILGEDQYFCVGDNRNNSIDSRTYGPFDFDSIKGIVEKRVINL